MPPMCIKGETYVTTSDVLSNHFLVRGSCDVSYWIKAEFRLKADFIRCVKCPLDISEPLAALRLDVSTRARASDLTVALRPQTWSMLRRGWPLKCKSQMAPNLTVHLSQDLGTIHRITASPGDKFQILAVPLTVTVADLPMCGPDLHDLIGNLLPTITVETRWSTTKVFGISDLTKRNLDNNSRHPAKIRNGSTTTQKQVLQLPPFYQGPVGQPPAGDSDHCFSATAMLELFFSDGIIYPSMRTNLIEVSYDLELLISLGDDREAGIMPCRASLKAPLSVKLT